MIFEHLAFDNSRFGEIAFGVSEFGEKVFGNSDLGNRPIITPNIKLVMRIKPTFLEEKKGKLIKK